MTRPDLDALAALLDKNPHDGTDAAKALLALPELLEYVRELEQQVRECDAINYARDATGLDVALAMRERCAQRAESAQANGSDCAAAIRALKP